MRTSAGVSPGQKLKLFVSEKDRKKKDVLKRHRYLVEKLSRLSQISFEDFDASSADSFLIVLHEDTEAYLDTTGLIDKDIEVKRLEAEKTFISKGSLALEKKLSNEAFIAKAPKELIKESEDKLATLRSKAKKIQRSLELMI